MDTVNPKGTSGSNPASDDLMFELSMPEKFEFKMVDASVLNDYEIWGAITSVLCNVFVGFFVATLTYTKEMDADKQVIPASQYVQNLLWIISIVFGVLVAFSLSMTLVKRQSMKTKSRVLKYKANVIKEQK